MFNAIKIWDRRRDQLKADASVRIVIGSHRPKAAISTANLGPDLLKLIMRQEFYNLHTNQLNIDQYWKFIKLTIRTGRVRIVTVSTSKQHDTCT